MTLKEYLKIIEKFIADYLVESKQKQYVLGLSGGVDSSLVATLTKEAVGKDKLTCIMIPIDSHPSDLEDALELAKDFDLNYEIIDLSEAYHEVVKSFEKQGLELDRSTKANIKVRLRMTCLYAYAQKVGGLVIGTDNADERYTGYFTKYGDGGVDLLPITKLLKSEVVEGCKIMGVKTHLAERTPSAGLFEGQTDETEMRVKYEVLDAYLLGKEVDEASKERIEHLHRISEHKRVPIPEPEEFIRDDK